ncbi:MAG: formate dehydrogenase accessory sulfurtransferase FdhD [Acidimicrobiaceae bacterium]|nr:formate dehydrogenase accessory sulfurtransferase FdhD [Acidimicrobiaceae bacterium]
MDVTDKRVAGLLLTGGASRRMGRDKATLVGPAGETLARYVASLLRGVADPVLEVGPGRSGLQAVADDRPGGGPLAAVATGARALHQRGWRGPVLLVATDLPALDDGTLAWLAGHPAPGAVVPTVGGRHQPLCARYQLADLRHAEQLLAEGKAAMRDLLDVTEVTYAEPPRPEALADVDTPEEWAAQLSRPVTAVQVQKQRPGGPVQLPDLVATEEPLEIRAAGPGQAPQPVAVTMRTPGHDFELAAGFLITEGLARADEIAGVAYCDAPRTPDERWNTVTVSLTRPWAPGSPARDFAVGASCGVCGKTSIDQVELACPSVPPGPPIPAALLSTLPDLLRATQRAFDQTGGLHAAGVFTPDGTPLCSREDVGRHNAVDKVIGTLALERRPLPASAILVVSGRVSFEITQKAAMARIGVIAAVSAPTSLAVQAAVRLGVTIAGFVRNGEFGLYSHPERIAFPK